MEFQQIKMEKKEFGKKKGFHGVLLGQKAK